MYKNYWLRRKAIREDFLLEDALVVYKLGRSTEPVEVIYPASEKRWKRIEITSLGCFPIMKDLGQPCGDWQI